MLICPICQSVLTRSGSSLVCEKRHSYDISKYGYVNLLMSQRGGNHGDNREMLLSRRSFLDSGAYSPMRDALATKVLELCKKSDISVLDSGCGECYYTSKIKELCESSGKRVRIFGIDISKEALRLAAQRFPGECKGDDPSVTLAVASSYSLPIKESSIDVLISVFAPLCPDQFARVLKREGIFITVIPGKKHLWELKSAIYDDPYENEIMPYGIEGFEFLGAEHISGSFFMGSQKEIYDLFTMTPYFCRTGEKDRAKLSALSSLDCTFEFEILSYKKV